MNRSAELRTTIGSDSISNSNTRCGMENGLWLTSRSRPRGRDLVHVRGAGRGTELELSRCSWDQYIYTSDAGRKADAAVKRPQRMIVT